MEHARKRRRIYFRRLSFVDSSRFIKSAPFLPHPRNLRHYSSAFQLRKIAGAISSEISPKGISRCRCEMYDVYTNGKHTGFSYTLPLYPHPSLSSPPLMQVR